MRLSKWKDPDDPERGNAKPGVPHYLDIVWAWLNANIDPFDLRESQMLWRVSMHYNHIHCSFLHRRPTKSTPVCDGGTLRTINPEGGWVLTIDTDGGTTPPPPDEGDEIVLKRGDKNRAVADHQRGLDALGFDMGTWEPWPTTGDEEPYPEGCDGDFGGTTETHVRSYQTSRGVDASGVIDGVTSSMILSDVDGLGAGEGGELPVHDHPHDHDLPVHDHPHDHDKGKLEVDSLDEKSIKGSTGKQRPL
jgi:hypothetical protein